MGGGHHVAEEVVTQCCGTLRFVLSVNALVTNKRAATSSFGHFLACVDRGTSAVAIVCTLEDVDS